MAKVRSMSDIRQEIAFIEHDFYQRYEESIKTSELGRIKYLHPLQELAISLGLIEEKAKIQKLQKLRADAWKPNMKNHDTVYTDASFYESLMQSHYHLSRLLVSALALLHVCQVCLANVIVLRSQSMFA